MPEYLTPGVYLEETSFRSKSIEGVPTSTFGMAGVTRYGPVPYRLGDLALTPRPVLVTSFVEYEREFGGLGDDGTLNDQPLYLAHAARAFFDNGGQRLYVARCFGFGLDNAGAVDPKNFAAAQVGTAGFWRARWPGSAGAGLRVTVRFRRSKNIAIDAGDHAVLKGVTPGAIVEEIADRTTMPPDSGPNRVAPVATALRVVDRLPDGSFGLRGPDGKVTAAAPVGAKKALSHLTLDIVVEFGDRQDIYAGLEGGSAHQRYLGSVLAPDKVSNDALVWFEPAAGTTDVAMLAGLLKDNLTVQLGGGTEGTGFSPDLLQGSPSDPDDPKRAATGLAALGELDDIAIVAAPDIAALAEGARTTAVDGLIEHCEQNRYRVAIVDAPAADTSITAAREFRSQFDTSYAALYYPWVDIVDPTAKNDPGAPPKTIALPPSGFVAGIYARSDIQRGVHKAPANEVILGMTRFRYNVTGERQAVLNPEGINALRFFPGRGNRVWGARTMSSDPEWKYVNVRRLFVYLEHSIDKSTQWAVFEPNNEALWANIRQTITDFLLVTWKTGALMGTRPEEAFFVRCDRTTMTQNDLDNGRLICLIGVAPTYPAEFVIFRIGQWTADAQNS